MTSQGDATCLPLLICFSHLPASKPRSEVGSADVVADRIAAIERQKDGNFTTDVLFAKDLPAGEVQTYLIEYRCDTSRGRTETGLS